MLRISQMQAALQQCPSGSVALCVCVCSFSFFYVIEDAERAACLASGLASDKLP